MACLTAILCGCSREERDWESAQAIDTQSSYEQFVRLYPDSDHVHHADQRLAELSARDHDESLPPTVAESAVQEDVMSNQASDSAPPVSAANGSKESAESDAAVEKPDKGLATPVPAKEPTPVAPATKTTRRASAPPSGSLVQLGAFGAGQVAAERAWQALKQTHVDLFADLSPDFETAALADGTEVVRLRVGPLNEQAANELCLELARLDVPCLPVHR